MKKELSITLSEAEVVAVIKWHMNQCRRITKMFGQKALELQARKPIFNAREFKALKDVCQEKLKEHTERAQGLASLLK